MWTSTLDASPERMLLMRLLARFWRGACFTSLSPLRVQNLPRSSLPANNWVRVRNRLAGVGGSDLRLLRGEDNARIAPAALATWHQMYPGHEVVGEVIEVGENVQHLRVGDRVILQNNPNCVSAGMQNLCRPCAVGEYNLCERALRPGPQPIGGGWSEEMLLHEQLLFRVDAELSDEQAVLLEATAIALHALLRRPPQPGEHVLIIGAGTVGLLMLQLVRALVPQALVSVLARHSFQVEQATRMGAAYIIYPNDSYTGVQRATGAQRYQGMLGNRMLLGGYDVIYDTVGSSKTLHHALRWVRAHGAVVLVGINPVFMHIDLSPLWFQQIDLIGSHSHGLDHWPIGIQDQQTTFSITQQLLKDGQIHPELLITHRFALNNYREALSVAMNKAQSRAIKVLFDYSLLPASVVPNVRASARKPRPAVVNSSAALKRPVTSDVIQEWPDIPVTPLPVPIQDEAEGEDTAHSLRATPKSAAVSSRSKVISSSQSSGQEEQSDQQSNAPEEEPYIADEDEATVVVRMADVQAAYKAMESLQSEPESQSHEPLDTPLSFTDNWLSREGAGLEIEEEVESREEESGEEPVLVEEEPVLVEEEVVEGREVEGEEEPVLIEEEVVEGREAEGEEEPLGMEADSETTASSDTEQFLEEQQIADQSDTELPEEEPETATNDPSQALQQVGKTFTNKPQLRQRNNKRSRSKK